MIINLFNKKIIFKIEDRKKIETYIKRMNNFFVILSPIIIIFIIFSFISNYKNFTDEFRLGEISDKEISARNRITYKDVQAKENLEQKIEDNLEEVYIKKTQAEKRSFETIDVFFEYLKKSNFDEEDAYTEILKNTGVFISDENVNKLLKMNEDEIDNLKAILILELREMYSSGIKTTESILETIYSDRTDHLSELEKELIADVVEPNLIYDEQATLEKLSNAIEEIEHKYVSINPGEVVLKKGEQITEEKLELLSQLGLHSRYKSFRLIMGLLILLLSITILFYYLAKEYIKKLILDRRYYYSTIILTIIMVVSAIITDITYFYYIYPFGMLVLLLGILVDKKFSIVISSVTLLYLSTYSGFHLKIVMLCIVDLFLGIYFSDKIRNRTDIINAGFLMGLLRMIVLLSVDLTFNIEIFDLITELGLVLISGILSGIITIGLLPYFENTFNILTDIKLLELGDFSHPLLRELLLKAPGTFNHSILVATLAEAGAESIGANSTFARVASYYHDIGKMRRPNFFVENQSGGENPHEKLTPHLSSLIIASHTKDGDEIARKYKIPFEIRNVMKEHQGTTMLVYFYNKAKKEQKSVSEYDYRYEGPKPRNRESAVIMLADTIEAAVRSMDDKKSVEVEKTIRKIIFAKIDDGQLSEAELTFKEIEIIIKTFSKVIGGVYHSRIKYPDVDKFKRK